MSVRKRPMQEMLCTICDLAYAFETAAAETLPPGCPRCARKDLKRLIDERTTLTQQRDALLAAIDLKRLVLPIGD